LFENYWGGRWFIMNIKLLVADDDPIFRGLVSDIIKKKGFVAVEAEDGQQAIDIFFASTDFDLIILDVLMPIYNGWEVLSQIRKFSDVPVIMLTALDDEVHEVLGLKKGADDYITKPFSYEVFTARLNAHLRKAIRTQTSILSAGKMIINQITHQVTINDSEIELNNKEYNLLIYFLKNKNQVLDREQILYNVWGFDFEGDIRTIDTHIKTLRSKLLDCGKYIKTVRGSGYKLEVVEE
jgi:two-component system, OmpR family, response regulator ResD